MTIAELHDLLVGHFYLDALTAAVKRNKKQRRFVSKSKGQPRLRLGPSTGFRRVQAVCPDNSRAARYSLFVAISGLIGKSVFLVTIIVHDSLQNTDYTSV